jgi:hypothetical protein
MGKNYYRIPRGSKIDERELKFKERLQEINTWDPEQILDGWKYIEDPDDEWVKLSPWDEFLKDIKVHLGKASSGWKFLWNFHDNKYYSTKNELIQFVLNGRVVDEYGDEIYPQDFLEMAFSWGEPDGKVADKKYTQENLSGWIFNPENHIDKEIDGLRVSSSTEFS